MIFHHLQALSKLSGKYNVRNVFLHGSYDEADFLPFIDSVISKFDFNIVYLQESDQSMSLQGGLQALVKHQEILMAESPIFLLVMNCNICSSFPLYSMLEFQERKQAMLTIMTTQDE